MWYLVMMFWVFSLIITIKFVLYNKEQTKTSKNKFINILLILFYVLILDWLESLKSPWTTWWNSVLFMWWVTVIFFIFLSNLIVVLGNNTFNYRLIWISRLSVGLITIFLIGKYWFPNWDWVYHEEVVARWSVIFIWVISIIEWTLFSVNHLLKSSTKKQI